MQAPSKQSQQRMKKKMLINFFADMYEASILKLAWKISLKKLSAEKNSIAKNHILVNYLSTRPVFSSKQSDGCDRIHPEQSTLLLMQ